jgi:hypothetical protein
MWEVPEPACGDEIRGWNLSPIAVRVPFSHISDLGCDFVFLAKLQGSKLGPHGQAKWARRRKTLNLVI